MKDFARKTSKKRNYKKNKSVFRSNRQTPELISRQVFYFIIFISLGLISISIFYFKTDVTSIQFEDSVNNVEFDFPSSLMENSVLIESTQENKVNCEYYVQIGAYGNRKYAEEAEKMLKNEIENITINIVYSTLQPGKPLNSVITGPYQNRSGANNAKERITKRGFDPRLRTLCKQI